MNDTVKAGIVLALVGALVWIVGGGHQTATEVGRIVALVGVILVVLGIVRAPSRD